jgi:adenine-specific DNA-methyltransferase
MTPQPIADYMASLFTRWPESVRLLDPGAGIGSLTDAFSERFLQLAPPGSSLEVDCYEIEPQLTAYLRNHLEDIRRRIAEQGHAFAGHVLQRDFIGEAAFVIPMGGQRYTHAILNPPYKKISSDSDHRKLLRVAGIETVNLYTAFLGLTIALMEVTGEIVAIIPRSFCNGTYFRPFRRFLLERTSLTHIHVFVSRSRAFKDDDVLQENIILKLVRGVPQGKVVVSHSHDAHFTDYKESAVPFGEVVKPDDPEQFIHVPITAATNRSTALFVHSLEELQLEVSTGPVVDFRVREHWLQEPEAHCVPLLYTHHFRGGRLYWPKEHKKPNALRLCDDTRKWLLPKGCYTITKRFSAKEERRRLVAYVVNPEEFPHEYYGFENHLNVFHSGKHGLSIELARGLALFLNSTLADEHFRSFSGHTQVNATDLRAMRYPNLEILKKLGRLRIASEHADQAAIDSAVEACL